MTYVVNRNINYTNLCTYKCQFCAFAKGKTDEDLRGAPYVLDLAEIGRRAEEAWARGATEVCLQGGIHPAFTGQTYLDVLHAVKEAVPEHARARLLAAGGDAGRAHARPHARSVPEAAEGRRPRQPAGHRGRDPRRRGPPR